MTQISTQIDNHKMGKNVATNKRKKKRKNGKLKKVQHLAKNSILEQAKEAKQDYMLQFLKGAPLGLREFLATGSPSKIMKNAFYFTLKALFVLKIFKFLS